MSKRCKECRNKKKYRYEQIQKEKELAEFLSTSSFEQIEKKELSLTDSKNTLFIIGNGFDLMHGVPSSYYNFRDSMGRHNELRNALEMYINKEDLWADFEESLAHLDDEAMLGTINDWMDIFDVKDQYDEDFSAADFFMAAETAMAPAQTIIRELPKRFRKWICTLNPTSNEKPLNRLINNQSTYITFNYTEFLEEIYRVPKNNIWYIHGDRRDKNKELILGHASGLEFEADNNTPMPRSRPPKIKNQTSYDLHETAGNHLTTASHTCSFGSADNSYAFRMMGLFRKSGINFVSCPTENVFLQGRQDTYPQRRGLTRVRDFVRNDINVAFGQDSIVDLWYPAGNGNMMNILDHGIHLS